MPLPLGILAGTAVRAAIPFIARALGPAAAQQTARVVAQRAVPTVASNITRTAATAAPRAITSSPAPVSILRSAGVSDDVIRAVASRPTISLRTPFTVGPTSSATRGLTSSLASRPAAGFPGYGVSGPVSAATRGVSRPLSSAPVSQGPIVAGTSRIQSPTIFQAAFSPPKAATSAAGGGGGGAGGAASAAGTAAGGGGGGGGAAVASTSRAANIAKGAGRFAIEGLLGAVPYGIQPFEEYSGMDVPPVLEAALWTLPGIVGVRGGAAALRGAKSLREAGKPTAARILQAAGLGGAGFGLYESGTGAFNALANPSGVQADEPTPEGVAPVLQPRVGDEVPVEPGSPEEEALTQIEAIDAAFQAAVDEVMANYGSVEEALLALESGDPMLAQALASLDAQYRQAQTAVAAQYSAAVGDIAGYQQQVDQLMQEAAEAQMADYAAAAGGLENIDVGLDPATAAMAADAGVSDTALGGGAITGAALSRGLAGAASAQNAADRMRVGGELAGQVAAGTREAAAAQAALTNQYLGQRYQTEREAMIAEAERRQAIDDAILQNKIRMGEALSSIELQRAQQLAALSPQDYAAATGQQRTMQTPAWFGAAIPGEVAQEVSGLTAKVEDVGDVPVSVGVVNTVLDQLTAASSAARDFYNQGDRARALAVLAEFYGQLDDELVWFETLGAPKSASEAYVQLFGESPV